MFHFEPVGLDTYRIVIDHSGKCLDVDTRDGKTVQ